ncbi:MAG: MFS transporter, partial [Actinomycetia bacterium]|nr:MFS transporter [Actinomycetes bacterium]
MIKRAFNFAFNIKPKEFWIVQLFFFFLLCISFVFTLGITVGDTLFLSSFGSARAGKMLPWVYIGIAVATVLSSYIIGFLREIFSKVKVTVIVSSFFVVSFIVFRVLVGSGILWVNYFLAIWVIVCGLISFTLFFAFMSDYFTSRDARRLYGYINGGLPLGTLIMGYGVEFLLIFFKTEDLLWICAGIFLIIAICPFLISRSFRSIEEDSRTEEEVETVPVKTLIKKPYSLFIFLFVICGAVVSVILDYQMKAIASQTMTKVELAVFFGRLYGYLGLVQIVIQFALVSFLLKKLGIVKSLFINPFLLLIASAAFFFRPTLMFAAGAAFMYMSFNETLDLPTRELLFFPLPRRLRQRAQSLTGGAVAPLGQGIGGLILLVIVFLFSEVKNSAIFAFVLAGGWLTFLILLVPRYKSTLEESLRNFELNLEDLKKVFSKPEGVKVIRNLLSNDDPEIVGFTLSLLMDEQIDNYIDSIQKLVKNPNPSIAVSALELLGRDGSETFLSDVKTALKNQNPSIRAKAIYLFCKIMKHRSFRFMKRFIASEDPEIRVTTLIGLAKYGGIESYLQIYTYIYMLFKKSPENRVEAIRVISGIGGEGSGKVINRYINDESDIVRKEAVLSLLKLQDPALIPVMVERLKDDSLRGAVISSLNRMPQTAVPVIV